MGGESYALGQYPEWNGMERNGMEWNGLRRVFAEGSVICGTEGQKGATHWNVRRGPSLSTLQVTFATCISLPALRVPD